MVVQTSHPLSKLKLRSREDRNGGGFNTKQVIKLVCMVWYLWYFLKLFRTLWLSRLPTPSPDSNLGQEKTGIVAVNRVNRFVGTLWYLYCSFWNFMALLGYNNPSPNSNLGQEEIVKVGAKSDYQTPSSDSLRN